MAQRLAEIRKVRLTKVLKLQEMGIDPYPSKLKFPRIQIFKARGQNSKKVAVSGRIMGLRVHGNISFIDLKDESGQIQLFFQKKLLKENFKLLGVLDIGDFILVSGKVFTTEAGEITVNVTDLQILTKSIRPLPSAWHGLKDVEERYRQRYVDLLLNDELKNLFRKKALFWQSMREFLIEKGFLEVETPVLENTAGGAEGNPFVNHHMALDMEVYLRI